MHYRGPFLAVLALVLAVVGASVVLAQDYTNVSSLLR
jgi:hypothetical protein